MNTLITPFFLFSFLASTVFGQSLTINSLMNVVQCQPSLLTWSGGVPPYFLSILPANQPTAAALVDLGRQNGNSFTWTANLTTGVSAFLQLRDSTGAVGQSGSFTVLASSDTSCINSTAAGASPSTSASTGASVPTGTTSPASGTTSHAVSSATGGTTKTSQGTSTSTGATQPKSSSAATASHYAQAGTLVMVGAAAVALVL